MTKILQLKNLTFLLWIVSLVFMGCIEAVKETHYIHWNTSNPIFRIDNTDHIIDVNSGNKPWEYDQVNIICPVYRQSPSESDLRHEDKEKSIIYSVTKDEFETCRITQPHPRVIAICNKPHELMYFTITFRSFTPTPGGMEFTPGKDYYFISTSSRYDLHQRMGGRCSSHHMKVAFKVADNTQHHSTSTHKTAQVVNVQRRPYPPGASASMDRKELSVMYRPPVSTSKKKSSSSSSSVSATAPLHPNEVIKHGSASPLAFSSADSLHGSSSRDPWFLCAILCVVSVFFIRSHHHQWSFIANDRHCSIRTQKKKLSWKLFSSKIRVCVRAKTDIL